MHICKSPRRKIARKCIFCAGVPAYARIRAGAMALKSNSASYNFSAERSLMPGIALQYLRWVEKPIDFWLRKEVAAGSVATT